MAKVLQDLEASTDFRKDSQGRKIACEKCVRGHRTSKCKSWHNERIRVIDGVGRKRGSRNRPKYASKATGSYMSVPYHLDSSATSSPSQNVVVTQPGDNTLSVASPAAFLEGPIPQEDLGGQAESFLLPNPIMVQPAANVLPAASSAACLEGPMPQEGLGGQAESFLLQNPVVAQPAASSAAFLGDPMPQDMPWSPFQGDIGAPGLGMPQATGPAINWAPEQPVDYTNAVPQPTGYSDAAIQHAFDLPLDVSTTWGYQNAPPQLGAANPMYLTLNS